MLSLARMSAFCALLFAFTLSAQNVGIGLYKHGTFDAKGFDTINMGNLNTHFEIPLISKAGRGMPFNYSLVYDGLIWSPVSSNGTAQWSPDPNWGFHNQLNGAAVIGTLTYFSRLTACFSGGVSRDTFQYSNYVYHEPNGRSHPLNYTSGTSCPGGPTVPASGDGSTSDGSGFSFSQGLIYSKTGQVIAPLTTSSGGGTITDANGNYISETTASTTTYTDTTGTTEATLTGSGNASSPLQITYPVTEQANSATTSASANVYYKTYSVATNFGCSSIAEYQATSVDLVDHITLATGDTYSFTYEATPNGSGGTVSGRLASITLPTGGTITYAYYGGTNAIVCSDGTPPGISRTTTDGQKTYNRGGVSGNPNAYTTTVTDERGKQTWYYFSVDSQGYYEATHRRAHDGTFSNTNLLEEDITCYNNVAESNGTCDGQTVTLPITEADTSTTFNYVATTGWIRNTYDSTGSYLTQSNVYNGSTLLTSTVNTYAAPGSVTELISTKTTDGNNNSVTYTGYGYDETTPTATSGLPQHTTPSNYPGNQTSVQVSLDGTTTNTLKTTTAYYDTGMPVSTTDPGGFTTTYGYDATGTFQTSTTLPTPSSGVGLSVSASYDAASGAALTATGLNSGQTFSATQYDALLRPTKAQTPEGAVSTTTYHNSGGAYQISSVTPQNSSQSMDTETFLDAYGRTIRTSVQSSSGWYVTDTCYANGVLQAQSTPYLSSSMNPSGTNCSSGNATLYTIDSLGRTTQIATPDGHTTSKSYNGRAVEIADSNGQTRILQKDVLGRLTGVCELTPSPTTWDGNDSTANCGFDIGGNGFTTAYAYNLAQHTTTVNQGVQTRVFQTDAAGRTISTQEPESGITTYSYGYGSSGLQSTYGLQVARTRPRANQTNPNVTTTSTTQYDAIGRVTDVFYNDGTPSKNFSYDLASGNALGNRGSSKGLVTGLSTYTSNGLINARGYAYDIMGRANATDECLPDWCGVTGDAFQWYSYDLASEMKVQYISGIEGGGGQPITINYSYNNAGQMTSVSGGRNNATNNPSLYSTTLSSMQPGGPQFITYGNNVTAYRQYDSMNRLQGQWVCGQPGGYNCPNGSHYFYGFGTQQSGGKLLAETDTVNGDWSQYNYDAVGNLSTAQSWNGNASNGFAAGYDRYGNRWNESVSNTASGSGPNQTLSFNTHNNQIQGFGYDAAGNLINDGQHTYQYDAENNLISIDSGSTASYTYTALSERDKVVTAAGIDRIGFDVLGRRSTTWQDGGAYVKADQYYSDQGPVAFFNEADNITHFEHQDWVGTERMRTDNVGSTNVASFSSLPFGEPNLTGGSDLDPAHFTGLDQDGSFSASSLGLHHATFREYNSNLGRWMSPDPYSGSYRLGDPQSFNRYSYVRNNPLAAVDPLGLDTCDYASYCSSGPGELACALNSSCSNLDVGSSNGDAGSSDSPSELPPGSPGTADNPLQGSTGYASGDSDSGLLGYISGNVYYYPVNGPYSTGAFSSSTASSSAPSNQILPCLVKGAAVGAVGAVAVGALAVGAVAVGAPVAAVTGVLGVLAVAGGAALGYDTIGQIRSGNWAGVAYNAGSVAGGAAVGGAGGRFLAQGINGVASPAWSWASDLAQRYNPSLGSIGSWLGTGPNPGSAGGSAAAAGAGAARAVKKGC